MKKLLGVVVAMMLAGCLSQARSRAVVVEAPDPVVGDLHCQAPHMTVSEALYYVPGPVQCVE